MKKTIFAILLFVFAGGSVFAEAPETGWRKGFYIQGGAGFLQASNDEHVVTGRKFNGAIDPAFDLTLGWDIADWIGPQVQMTYGTTTGEVGNGGAAIGAYPAGTFPTENARQHIVNFSILAKATLPYFTRASWQKTNFKIVPYAKLGGTGYGMFVNSPTDANKSGAFGGGPAAGVGCDFFVWKGLFVSLDFTEQLIIQKAYYRTIAGINTKVTNGGFKPHAQFLGLVGWHF